MILIKFDVTLSNNNKLTAIIYDWSLDLKYVIVIKIMLW